MVAERCAFTFEKQPATLPDFPVPEGFDIPSYFEKIARDGFERRLQRWRAESDAGRLRHTIDAYRDRLSREIRVVQEMGFAGYFLIVWDFIRFSRESGIPVGPGRGSAAGSLVAYCLQITDIDPMEFDLLFERFLNPERISMPDIDIDFCFRKRERVIDYVTGKYGRPNVAQIITFGTMAARAVIRDAGRGLDIPYAEVDKIAKLIPQQPGQEVTIAGALAEVPALKLAYQSDPKVKELIDVGRRLEGLVRHASTHAAGVVIAPKPIVEFAPLYRGTDDAITTQFAMSDIEEIGLLKMDFLGLKTLTLIEDALGSIAGSEGARPDLDAKTLDDPTGLRAVRQGAHRGHLPVRVGGDAQHSEAAEARPLRGPGRDQRPLPARADRRRADRRFHQAAPRKGAGRIPASAARGDPRRDLRRHRLSGAGDADRVGHGRVLARRGRHLAARDGEEEQGRHGRRARALRRARDRARA